jgi:hypothetical protein
MRGLSGIRRKWNIATRLDLYPGGVREEWRVEPACVTKRYQAFNFVEVHVK